MAANALIDLRGHFCDVLEILLRRGIGKIVEAILPKVVLFRGKRAVTLSLSGRAQSGAALYVRESPDRQMRRALASADQSRPSERAGMVGRPAARAVSFTLSLLLPSFLPSRNNGTDVTFGDGKRQEGRGEFLSS